MFKNYIHTMLFFIGAAAVPLHSSAENGPETGGTQGVQQAVQPAVKQIRGFIGDENGDPIIGATVLEKGKTNGTATDVDGTFTLNVT